MKRPCKLAQDGTGTSSRTCICAGPIVLILCSSYKVIVAIPCGHPYICGTHMSSGIHSFTMN
jgi:hypothetical protein